MEFTTVIKPQSSLFTVDFKEIWQYRDLLSMFVKRNIITQYKQTILGPVWFFLQPLFTTLIFLVFNRIAKIPIDNIPQPLFFLSGIVIWQYFSDCLNKTSSTFNDNQAIFGKVYFPRLIVPLATVISNFVRLGIQLLLFLMLYLYYYFFTDTPVLPNWYLLLFPLLIVMLAGLSLGFGILISSMTTKYRDMTILFTFIVQLWMYATPVLYPLSAIPGKYQWILVLNPITSIFETFRYGMMNSGTFNWNYLAYSFIFMIFILGTGIIFFNKVQKSFMDTV